MFFNLRTIATAALALASISSTTLAAPTAAMTSNGALDKRALTPAQIVDNIRMLTSKSQALQAPANSITIVNGPLIIIGQGPFPRIIAGFTDIVSTATTAIAQMQGSAPVTTAADATAIADAFREFVRVHQVLLNILIGKAGLFQTVPFIGQPVAAVLRQIESAVDTIAFGLIGMFESAAVGAQRQAVQSDANSLGMTIQTTIKSYEGLSTN